MNTQPAQSDETVLAAMRGDAQALRAIWAANRRWVAAVIIAHKPKNADTDDLLQEVAATLVSKVHTLTSPGSLGPWLRTIAVNAARLAGRKAALSLAAQPVLSEQAGVRQHIADVQSLELAAERDEAQRVYRYACELPEDYREPLLLRCVQDLSYRQIAQILELPETTIETRIARARRMVRERVAAADEQREKIVTGTRTLRI